MAPAGTCRSTKKCFLMRRTAMASHATHTRVPLAIAAALAASYSSSPQASCHGGGATRWSFALRWRGGFVIGLRHLDMHLCRRGRWERVEQGPDCGQRALVAGDPPPLDRRVERKPSPRPGDGQLVTDLRLLRPLRCRTGAVKGELHLQGALDLIETPGGVGADRRPGRVLGPHRPVRAEVRQGRCVLARGGQEDLDVECGWALE